jgi:4'-phosphopantetheinyl transferase
MKLPNSAIHVWCVALDVTFLNDGSVEQALSPSERARADRFRFEQHRRRFILSHVALREILARYLQADPAKIEFNSNLYGKPYLAGTHADSEIRFNLAHSHELALVALTRGCEIGVDVEHIRPIPDLAQIARRFFSLADQTEFSTLPPFQQSNAFYACWTRKEAFIKAVGDGLIYPLDQFNVTLIPGEPARFLRVGNDPSEAGKWTLVSFQPSNEYMGAVALRARNIHIQHFNFSWN